MRKVYRMHDVLGERLRGMWDYYLHQHLDVMKRHSINDITFNTISKFQNILLETRR